MKATAKAKLTQVALDKGLDYALKDPRARLPKVLDIIEKADARHMYQHTYDYLRGMMADPDNVWMRYIDHIAADIDHEILKKLVNNLVVYSGIYGNASLYEARAKYNCNIPWAILMDPTSACNLTCTGCWAAEYGHQNNLSQQDLNRIIEQGKELGVYVYIYSGGEPLVKKDLLIQLCDLHPDCTFLAFTNGTLVDEAFADELRRVGNFLLAFSIEGFEAETDMRRGQGTYAQVIRAMGLLQTRHVPFGFSTCYHAKNTEAVGSEAYIDDMIARGCLFGWYFTYMPVGVDAVPELMATSDQRAQMYRRVRRYRQTKPIFLMDFWNDGSYVGGCIAGGRRYLHINAAGDVEPCAFIHYSNVNIHDHTLLEALQSPLFMAYHEGQPFNGNHLRPCPLLDNPGALADMVHCTGAHSTEMLAPEDVDALTDKIRPTAERWADVADGLWQAYVRDRAAQGHAAPADDASPSVAPQPEADAARKAGA